jgi:RHS repeat-associated protein
VAGAAHVSAHSYDTEGNRTSMTYPSGRIVTYTYDLAGRQISAASGGTSLASAGTYLPFGPLTGFTFGNGLKKAMSYDARYRVTENKLFQPPNNIARYSYSYDPAGNITGIQDMMDATYSRTFGYDDLNRLVTANTGASLWGTGSYAYDPMGNLTSRSLGVPPVDNGIVLSDPGRHLRAAAAVTGQVDRLSFTFQGTKPNISAVTSNGIDHTVSYDAAGNETSYFASRTYSPQNLMSTVTDTAGEGPAHQVTYGYDYRGVRVSRTETPTDAGSSTRYFFYTPELQFLSSTVDDSNNVWGQSAHIMSAPLAMNREIIWFAGQPVAEFGPPRTPDATGPLSLHRTFGTNTPANNLFYTFTDHLGTPLLQTDPSTAIVWRAEYEPYGNVYLMRKGSRADQPLRFPGQEAAMTWEGTEENYNVFRWYRAGWGRYSQADPVGFEAGTNFFGYASGNPISASDPFGLLAVKACATRWISLAGGVNHIPLIGGPLSNAIGDNLLGFCASCPAGHTPRIGGAHLTPTPPAANGIPDLTLQPVAGYIPGATQLRQDCGGCDGPNQHFFVSTVKTRLSVTQSRLNQQASIYSVEYECTSCKATN